MIHRTTSLQQAAALLANEEIKVEYSGPAPTSDPGRFEFVFEIISEEEDFNQWVKDYMHRRTRVEPKTYDSSLNTLRDTLNLVKSNHRG